MPANPFPAPLSQAIHHAGVARQALPPRGHGHRHGRGGAGAATRCCTMGHRCSNAGQRGPAGSPGGGNRAAARHRRGQRPGALHRADRARRPAGWHTRQQPDRLPGPQPGRRQRQRYPGQPLPERHHLPWLPRIIDAGHAARPLGLPGWRARQRAVRRCDQLGHDPRGRAGKRVAGIQRQPGLWPEQPGRRAGHDHPLRPGLAGLHRRPVLWQRQPQARDLSGGVRSDSGWHAFAAGTLFQEHGWRDNSSGRLGNVFAKAALRARPTAWTCRCCTAAAR